MRLVQKALFIVVAIIVSLIIILNMKTLYCALLSIGTAICSSGVFIISIYYIIHSNIKIVQMKILNNAISLTLQNTVTDILNTTSKIGWILTIIGIILILISNVTGDGPFWQRKKEDL